MSWNRSDPAQKPVAKKKPVKWHGLVALVVIVAVGAALLFVFKGDEPPKVVVEKKSGLIKEVTPAAAPTNVVEEVKPKPIDPNARPTKIGEVVNGYVMLPSGRLHRRLGVVTNSIADRVKAPCEIFDHDCENEIACYLTLKPGDTILGTINYNGQFKKDFLESLKVPIVVTDEDTPEQAQLKRDMIETKIELKAAMDRGEDIEQIMTETRQQLQDLMVYKTQIQMQFNEMRQNDPDMSQTDVDTLLEACNKMLEKKGIAPLNLGPITKRNLKKNKEKLYE